MTKPLIKLPSVELREAREALDKSYAEIADKDAKIADKDTEIADSKAKLADKDAEIAHLKEMLQAQGCLAGSVNPLGYKLASKHTVIAPQVCHRSALFLIMSLYRADS